MNSSKIMKHFGIKTDEAPISIYPFSPVYKVQHTTGNIIIKRTQQPLEKAKRLMKYLLHLRKNKIDIVTPVVLDRENPIEMEDACYVAYPFIEGEGYIASEKSIKEAGRLLGSIHRLSESTNTYQLPEYNVYDFTIEEVEESMAAIRRYAMPYKEDVQVPKLRKRLLKVVGQQDEINHAKLPHVATPHDYKANNLVYTPEPFLIDPDNATWIPRIFDLALVLLLFHNELETAPDRTFTPDEWYIFMDGYTEYVRLTMEEKHFWKKAVEHVFLDEVMWLMAEVPEDWKSPSQRNLFQSIVHLLFHIENYHLN
ncbi:phosphotransferase [Virgibacillus salexigens]|uniref:phosphotransferase n=1 Tax=Virgibacillus massiliensis TaxID=1462526 RepID=UPI00136FF788|nr:phosphotransferase [Virgibacillus massiliensis]MYL42944.1 phosphotransferase [Virgibacillus massiliensis]